MTQPDRRVFTTPATTYSATVVAGALTAVFPGVPYKRRVNSLVVKCDQVSDVEIYSGLIAPSALIGTHPVGNQNTYMPPNRDEIPAGFPVFVRWPDATGGTASATIVFEGSY